jgi:hypothetical protein
MEKKNSGSCQSDISNIIEIYLHLINNILQEQVLYFVK